MSHERERVVLEQNSIILFSKPVDHLLSAHIDHVNRRSRRDWAFSFSRSSVFLDPWDRTECISTSRAPGDCVTLHTILALSVIHDQIFLRLCTFANVPDNSGAINGARENVVMIVIQFQEMDGFLLQSLGADVSGALGREASFLEFPGHKLAILGACEHDPVTADTNSWEHGVAVLMSQNDRGHFLCIFELRVLWLLKVGAGLPGTWMILFDLLGWEVGFALFEPPLFIVAPGHVI